MKLHGNCLVVLALLLALCLVLAGCSGDGKTPAAQTPAGTGGPAPAGSTPTLSDPASAAAIEAALYPDETFIAEKYLYFCSKDPDTGELYFSKTLAEHEAAVSIYAPLWQAYDQRTGAQ